MMGVHNFLGPKIASVYATSGAPALRRYVFEANAALAVPMLGLCAVLYIAGEWMLGLVYGEAFAAGAPVMTVLAINLTLLALAFVFSRGLFAIERADLDFQVNFIPLVLLFAAGIPLVREYGIKGAAWALCLANGVALCCRMAAFLIAQPREEVVAG
jgi:O-antigen/teichoic acid export membrane protein